MENAREQNQDCYMKDAEDDINILNKIVLQYREVYNRIITSKKITLDDELSVMICHNLCNDFNVHSTFITFNNAAIRHLAIAIEMHARYYILDPDYKKFFKGANYKVTTNNLSDKFEGLPGFFALRGINGKTFSDEIINKGYFECTIDNMKTYCDSFALMEINKGKKLENLVYLTDISGQKYFSDFVLDKFGVMILIRR